MNTVPGGSGGVPAADPFAEYDAAYVFGSLAPDERAAYERHLLHCSDCSAAVAAMAGIPGLLARVPVEQVTGLDESPAPATLLPRLVAEVSRQRVRARWRAGAVLALAAACVLGLLVALAVDRRPASRVADGPTVSGGATRSSGSASSGAPATTSSLGVGPDLPMTPVGHTGLAASVQIQDVAWGTRITMRCSEPAVANGVRPYTGTYYLVAVDKLSSRRSVATWHPLPGKTVHIEADTGLRSKDITSLLVVDADHDVLLKLDI